MKLQLKRSNVLISGAAKEPTASQLDYGELAINYSAGDAAIFLKDSTNNVIRISGVGNIADDGLTNVPTTTSPPTSPTPEAGNLWYNSEDGRLYIYYVDDNSSQWVDASPDTWQTTVIPDTTNPAHQAGTLDDRYINTNGDTLTGALLLDNAATVATPDLAFDGDLNTGIYSPGADSLAITTAGTQRVTVVSSGNVGIGTNSPGYNLQVSSNSTSSISIASSGNNTGGRVSRLVYSFSDGDGASINATRVANSAVSDVYLSFRTGGITNADEKVRITSSGNVGIGDSSPDRKLQVINSTDALMRLGRSDASSHGSTDVEIKFSKNYYSNAVFEAASHRFEIQGTEKMRIDSSGNVGIGTSSPSEELEVVGAVPTVKIRSTSNNTPILALDSNRSDADVISGQIVSQWDGSAVSAIRFHNGDDAVNKDNGQIAFLTAAEGSISERMRIIENGNVGIGTDSPQSKLHVQGSYTTAKIWLQSTNNGQSSFFPENAGIDLTANGMNSTSKYTPSINFGSTDPNFTTTNPKFGAAINAESTQSYSTDTTGGMKLNFWTSPSNPGTGHGLEQRMTISQFGNVGIGTSSPQAKLDILRIDSTAYNATASDGQVSNGASLYVRNQSNTNLAFSQVVFGQRSSEELCRIVASGGSAPFLAFTTADAERMRIDSSGRLLLGTSSIYDASYKMQVAIPATGGIVFRMGSSANKFPLAFQNQSGSYVGSVKTTTTSTIYGTSSDYRLKENIVDISDGITRVKQLAPKRFNFIVDTDTTVDGFIAHEAQAVVPESVVGVKDGMIEEEYEVSPEVVDGDGKVTEEAVMGTRTVPDYQGIDQGKLVPLLTAALQEAIAKIETLEAKVAALEAG